VKTLKIWFSDFWADFNPQNNFFYNLLSTRYKLELDEHADVLVCSRFGRKWETFTGKKILFTGENIPPRPELFDYSLSFQPKSERNYYLPLYKLYKEYPDCFGERRISKGDWQNRKTASIVFSCSGSRTRNQLFRNLRRDVGADSGGRVDNTVGGPVDDKLVFIKNYKFNLALENTSWPGYTTEKIIQAYAAGTVPVYWGDPLLANTINTKAAIIYEGPESYEAVLEAIRAAAQDFETYKALYEQPLFLDNKEPAFLANDKILDFLVSAIEGPRYVKAAGKFQRAVEDYRYERWMQKRRFLTIRQKSQLSLVEFLTPLSWVVYQPFGFVKSALRRVKRLLKT